MYRQDWLDQLRWSAVALGVGTAAVAQIIVTLLVLQPLALGAGWTAVVLVELCVAAGAFVAGWRAQQSAALVNGVITALVSAVLSLSASAFGAAGQLSLISVVFLFATFAAMGVLGSLVAGWLQGRRAAAL